eukprot:TRINITY_DN5493_c0_g1_i1.p2 TRINITY_DN5493_c0_g1~~TRINITY_DN5493_c0_g1_i1.p2  ORF type:complete len:127 (+),score=20.91 TRINITY_DN5493_c0_g1_i1:806-1186(+)
MSSSYSISNDYVPKCPCGEMICLTSCTNSNPNRKFWRCPNWKDKKGCGRFIWKDEVDHDKNVAALMEDMKKTMDNLSENICLALEEMRHVAEERKKNKQIYFCTGVCHLSCNCDLHDEQYVMYMLN